jgi:hypothetical protein
MKYLPFETITYRTNLPVEEVIKRLRKNIRQKKKFIDKSIPFVNVSGPYAGTIKDSTFKISREISYNNSFLPVITGHVEQNRSSTNIYVKMRPHFGVLIFMSIWFSGVFVGALAFTLPVILGKNFELESLMAPGMVLFGYLLTTLAFKYESKKAKKFFEELFEVKKKN